MSNLVGATTAVFPVRLSVASNEIVNVEWTTSDGTALSGLDYKAAKGVVKFLPGETEKQIQALVYGQPIVPAADKVFYIRLSPPSNAILVDSLLTCKIVVDDLVDPPATSIIVAEGRRGPKGETGRSAYEQAVYMGLFTGTVEQWMQQIADASSAADRAENAAVAANIGSKVYATPQAGVNINTGVPAGDYFNVRSLSSNHYVDEYQNVAGVATATGKSYPNIGWVERNAAIAEAAAISATISSGIYQTPSAGVAPVTGVPAGDYFNVRSVNSEHYVDEYQNVAGVATATGKSYPSSLAVDLTKQQILDVSDRVGNTWRNKVGSYGLNDRVMLENGDIVKSTVANNIINPNLDMTGWLPDSPMKYITNISDLKNYKPLKNDQIIKLLNYDDNVQSVFNKYIYRAASNIDDNQGTVIASNVVTGRWLMIPKAEYVPEDFGVASGDFIATNTARIKSYLESGLSLDIPPKTYIAHPTFLSVTINKPTKIIGRSITNSILEKLQIITKGNCDSSKFKNFRINTLSMNYSIYVNGGSYMQFENIHTYHNYDGICFYNNTGTRLKRNAVKNCISEKSGRVGFAVDIGGEDTVFENLASIDCKQAYHFEGCKDSKLRNSKAISCGLGSSLSSGEQDGYAGPLRSYMVDGLEVDGLENITPVGTFQWQHGGGLNADAVNSNDLVFKNMRGCGPLILDEEIAKTRNATFKNIDQLAIYTSGFKQKFTGKVIVENCVAPVAGIDELMIHGADIIYIEDTVTGRLQLTANKIRTKNLTAKTKYFHVIEAEDFKAIGILENVQTSLGDPEWFHGFCFVMANCVRLVCDALRLSGVGGGSHLVFGGIGETTKEINLGDYQEDISTSYRINDGVYGSKDVFSDFGIQYNNRRTFRRDTVPVSGIYRVGDMILKNTVTTDTIYGWICTTGGTGVGAIWRPMKYSA